MIRRVVLLCGLMGCSLSSFAFPYIYSYVNGERWEYDKISDTEASIVGAPRRTGGVVRVPEEIDGLKVVSISSLAFGAIMIDDDGHRECFTRASEIIIPKTVTEIQCFMDERSEMPFGDIPFLHWFADLEKITVEEGNPKYFSRQGVLYSRETNWQGESYSRLCFCPAKVQDLIVEADTLAIGQGGTGMGYGSEGSFGMGYNVSSVHWGGNGLTNVMVEADNKVFSSEDGMLYDKAKSSLFYCPRKREGRVLIPQSVKSIHLSAFIGCANLSAIDVEEENPCYSSRKNLLCSKDGKTLYAVPGARIEIEIPDSVENIQHASESENLERVSINASLKNMALQA